MHRFQCTTKLAPRNSRIQILNLKRKEYWLHISMPCSCISMFVTILFPSSKIISFYHQTTSFYDQTTSFYIKCSCFYDQIHRIYNQTTSFYDQATSFYDQTSSSYIICSGFYDRNSKIYDECTSLYDQTSSMTSRFKFEIFLKKYSKMYLI